MATLDLEKFKIKKPSFFSRLKEAIPFTEEAKQFRQRKQQERLRLPEQRKAIGNFLRKSFVEPVKVRPLLSAKEETLPFGGKVIGGTLSLGQRIIEDSIIGGLKIASTLKSNRQQARGETPTPIKFPIDVTFQKLFSDDLTTTREFKSMLDEAYTEIDRLDQERPDKPTLNLLQGATQEIFMPILDAVDIVGVGELATRGARQVFTSREAKKALRTLGITAFRDASEAGIKNQTKRKFNEVFKQVEQGKITEELATKKLNEIGQALDTLSTTKQSRFGKLGEEVRKVANILTEERPAMESLRALKESASAGLSIKRVDDVPDEFLLQEARKLKERGGTVDEFVELYTKNPEKIPTTPEYQKFLKEKDAFVKRENEIYAEMKAMRDKYVGKTIKDVPPKEITKYENLQKELNQTLSKKTLAPVPEGVIKTHIGEKALKSQLTDIWERAVKGKPQRQLAQQQLAEKPAKLDQTRVPSKTASLPYTLPKTDEVRKLPAVIQGETFSLGTAGETVTPTIKTARAELKATKKEIKNAEIAREKAAKLEAKQQKVRQEAMENLQRFRGNTDSIIESLKSRHLSDEDIANIVLEDGTKLVDTAKIKRNKDGSLSTYILKKDLDDIKNTYTDEVPKDKWGKRSILVEGAEVPIKAIRSIELPYAYFERKGLNQIYEPIIQAGRDAEVQKGIYIKRFKDAGLFKEGGWFTADRFTLSKNESEGVARYFLGRQGRGKPLALEELSQRARKFVEIFDVIIAETEERFFEIAKKLGKEPGKVENYAPIMTRSDIKLVDEGGAMDWLFRNHPAFFSLKERAKHVPFEMYNLDYREVAIRWLDGVTSFLNYGETTNKLKYLTNSDEFKAIIKGEDQNIIDRWLREITTPHKPTGLLEESTTTISRLLRKGVAVGALGLNYASVLKQALTQVPILIIEKAVPKRKSRYAEAFGIDVSQLPSITKRRGDIAIQDLQGRIGRIFTGALTQFDKKNAQISLNALLDKELNKILKSGIDLADITPEMQKIIEKNAQDALDMWYGGFFKGQRPEAFRRELGNFILMFLYPLTSQLNGFARHFLKAKGLSKYKAAAEVVASVATIAYLEQVIENLSPQWSDEKEMAQDILQSMVGNVPVVGNIVYSIMNDTEFNVSPVLANINNLRRNIVKGEGEKIAFSVAETFGLPKQIRRIREGMQIMEEGGITDNEGKMSAPVQGTIEIVRSFLRGKYGSIAAQDWVRNIGEKSEDRRWFVPQVEFLQNGDYDRKAELYRQFPLEEKLLLRSFLSEGQQKRLDSALKNPSKKIDLDKFKINLEEFKLKQPQE